MIPPLPPGVIPNDFPPLPRGARIPIGTQYSTVLPDIDFETYSEAGFFWSEELQKWEPAKGAPKKGLPGVGTPHYLQHPTTEVLSCSYNLKDGAGVRRWQPGWPLPADLIKYLLTFDPWATPSYEQSGIIEAHNSAFEMRIIIDILHKKFNWPLFELEQFRCSAAKARANGYPGKLAELGKVLKLKTLKLESGKKLLEKFSVPQKPTKKNGYKKRILLTDDPIDAENLFLYNDGDVITESEASQRLPDLPPSELEYWLADQRINYRGVECDSDSVADCVAMVDMTLERYDGELEVITGGLVTRASQTAKLKDWLSEMGVELAKMDAEHIEEALTQPMPDDARRALEIRALAGSASVKKVFAMARQVTPRNRLEDMAIYHGARTGRDNGDGVQPLNMPKAGPKIRWCTSAGNRLPYAASLSECPHCRGEACAVFSKAGSWEPEAVDFALQVISLRNLDIVESIFGDALLTVSGCVRGLFISKPGHLLQGVDYSSIEAVVSAVISGEQWRIDAFIAGRDIYLESAARITGKSYDWYMANGGKSHPDRQKIGKPAELGLGFGGWLGAWRQFDKTDTFSDVQVKNNIKNWRKESPNIVEMWGGQYRGVPWNISSFERYGLEGAAVNAILHPGQRFHCGIVSYLLDGDTLLCRLPSGRNISYQQPSLRPSKKVEGTFDIYFWGWNTNPKKGALGWIHINTYGGQLFENVVQAIARDIMAHGVVNLEKANYPVVLRVHDEVVTEVPIGWGSIAEQVKIMTTLPTWATGWPIRAAGWKAPQRRYMKD